MMGWLGNTLNTTFKAAKRGMGFGNAAKNGKRGFAAAQHSRMTANWQVTEASINRELQGDLNRLRARGRQLVKDNDFARKFKGMVSDNIIGPDGVRYQARVFDKPDQPDRMANNAIESAWARWKKVADITGRADFDTMCRSAIGGMPSDGEFLWQIVTGKDAGNPFNIAIHAIDVDRIDTQFNGEYKGNTVIMGVEVNTYRRPVALHIFAAHPSDGARSSRERVRIPADQLIHCYQQEYPDQIRGIPWMTPGMLSLHHLGSFMLSALMAAENGANHYGFFERKDGGMAPPNVDGLDTDGKPITTSVPGFYDTLPEGVTHSAFDSPYPNEVFSPFTKTILQRVASGWRVNYNSLGNDLEGVNYSSIRAGTIEDRDRWKVDQQHFINTVLERIQPIWLQMALFSGQITMPNGSPLPASKYDKFAPHEWQPRRWEWVDPTNDMNAKILAVTAGVIPPQDIASDMGYDFDDVLVKIASAQTLAKALGIQLPAYDSKPGANSDKKPADAKTGSDSSGGNGGGNGSNDKATGKKPADAKSDSDGAFEALGTAVARLASKEQPAPVFNITNNMPEQRHETHNHIAPTPVQVRNEVNVPETTVNVEAIMPQHREAAPAVNVVVQPAPVTVNNTHPSKAVQVVKRDKNDEITSTETTYHN